jgi:hypothetical protein
MIFVFSFSFVYCLWLFFYFYLFICLSLVVVVLFAYYVWRMVEIEIAWERKNKFQKLLFFPAIFCSSLFLVIVRIFLFDYLFMFENKKVILPVRPV